MDGYDSTVIWTHADGWVDLTDAARAATEPWTVTTENRDRFVIDVTAMTVTHVAEDGTPTPDRDRPFDLPTTPFASLHCVTSCGAAWSRDDIPTDLTRGTPRLLMVHRGPPDPSHAADIADSDALLALTRREPWDDWNDHPEDPCLALHCIRDPSSRSATA